MPDATVVTSNMAALSPAPLVAVLTASIGLLGFIGKSLIEYGRAIMEERRLFRTAVIRFYNDVNIWQRDFRTTYTDDVFDRLADMVVEGPDDFKFATPSSDVADYAEIMKFIHRMDVEEARLMRCFIMYSEMLTSMSRIMSDEMASFSKPRKLNTLAQYRGTAEYLYMLSSEIMERMERNLYLRRGKARVEAILDRHQNFSENANRFAARHIKRLTPSGKKKTT